MGFDIPDSVKVRLERGPADNYPLLRVDNTGNLHLFFSYNEKEHNKDNSIKSYNFNSYYLKCIAPEYATVVIHDDFRYFNGGKDLHIGNNGYAYCTYAHEGNSYISIFDSNANLIKDEELGFGLDIFWGGLINDNAYLTPCWSSKEDCSFIKVGTDGKKALIGKSLEFSKEIDSVPFGFWDNPQVISMDDSTVLFIGHSRLKEKRAMKIYDYNQLGIIIYDLYSQKLLDHKEINLLDNPGITKTEAFIDHPRIFQLATDNFLIFSDIRVDSFHHAVVFATDSELNIINESKFIVSKLSHALPLDDKSIQQQFIAFKKHRYTDKLGIFIRYALVNDTVYYSESDIVFNKAVMENMVK
jgi:hypothetical protein